MARRVRRRSSATSTTLRAITVVLPRRQQAPTSSPALPLAVPPAASLCLAYNSAASGSFGTIQGTRSRKERGEGGEGMQHAMLNRLPAFILAPLYLTNAALRMGYTNLFRLNLQGGTLGAFPPTGLLLRSAELAMSPPDKGYCCMYKAVGALFDYDYVP
ncbi:hypothetical protein SCHPADRAFT_896968 [Schizopora paradoxa]|uniref:Uncharacterized protein n=1 Tax=Schizopora paradoxa TaxID=27342 RepID=A0A0H2RI64_9AGAM|nr:hypothetical protein SCHPADRAFT_896968 [Schizopora paradoxa]